MNTASNSTNHKLVGVPTDARASNGNLIVTVDGKDVTLISRANSKINLTATVGNVTKTYTAAVGTITNVTDGKVTLTSNFSGTSYTAATGIVEVNATAVGNAINLDGSKTTNVTLLGGSGDDTLTGGSGNSSLDGGIGNDFVNISGGTATVNVSVGDDSISVGSGVTEFTVEGFKEGNVIQLDESFSGDLSVDDDKLKLDKLTIAGISKVVEDVKEWADISGGFSYMNYSTSGVALKDHKIAWEKESDKETLFELSGISNVDGITPTNDAVTVAAANIAAGASKVSVSNDAYTLTLSGVQIGKPESETTGTAFGDVANNSASYIQTVTTAEYWTATDKQTYDLTQKDVATNTLFELSGISNVDGITPTNDAVTVAAANIATGASKVAVSNDAYTLTLSGVQIGKPESETTGTAFGDVANNSASYIQTVTTAEYWTATDKQTYDLTQKDVATNTLFELSGISNVDGITPTNDAVTVAAANIAAGASKVAVSNDAYTLTLSGVQIGKPESETTGTAFSAIDTANHSASYIQTVTTAEYWTATDKQTYDLTQKDVATNTLFELSGISNVDGITPTNDAVTVAAANIAAGASKVAVSSDDYTLTLTGVDTAAVTTDGGKAFSSVSSDNKATYNQTINSSAYWTKTNGQTYDLNESVSTSSNLFTLEGISNTAGIAPTDDAVTVAAANIAAGANKVAVSNDAYTLTLTGVDTEAVTTDGGKAFSSVSSDNKATYNQTINSSAYWTKTNGQTYDLNESVAATSTLFTLTGITTVADSLVGDTTVTLGRDNLTTTGATLSNGADQNFTLVLADGAAQSAISEGFDGNVYKQARQTDGYTKDSDTVISYQAASGGEALFSVDNADTVNVSYANSGITATGESAAELSIGSALNDSVLTIDGFVEIDGLNATNHSINGTPTDVIVDSGALVVTADDTAITISGAAKQTINFTDDGKGYTAAANRIMDVTDENAKSVTLTSVYTNTSYTFGKAYSAGVTKLDATKAASTKFSANGASSDADLVLTGVLNAPNTLTGGAGADTITGGDNNDNLTGNAGADVFVQSAGIDTITDYTEGEDIISLQSSITATDSDKNNVTISTDAGSIIVTGGSGQVIKTVDDKGNEQDISLSGGVPTNASVNGEDLVVTADGKDSTYEGMANGEVTITASDSTYLVSKNRIMDVTDENAKGVTLTTDYNSTSYTFGKTYSAGVTKFDGTQAASTKFNANGASSEADLVLTGVLNATNTLTGGSGADTITGGDKNDRLTGNAGADVFVQSGGTDTIVDYIEGEDIISLQSALVTKQADESNVTLGTGDDSIIVTGGVGQVIKIVDYKGKEEELLFMGDAPTNASVNGDDLVVTAGGKDYTFAGAAKDTVTITSGDNTYTAAATRIMDITDENAKSVTLTTDYNATSYTFGKTYSEGVTKLDATQAASTKFNANGASSEADLVLTGVLNATNTLTGGSGADTLTGGDNDDSLTGNAGADVFVQSGGTDTITDYTEGEDIISLQSALVTTQSDGVNVTLSTGEDSIIVTGGVGQSIKTFDDKGNEQDISLSVSGVPTNASVNGDDLVVTIDGKDSTYAGKAKDTVTITSGDRTYTATKNRIMDITDENAKSVTLTTDYNANSYTFGKTYSEGVTKLDATKAASTKFYANGVSSEADLVLTGVLNATNTLTGGSGADTLTGGDNDDSLTGNAGADVFVQSGGTDTIIDYTEGEDIISLQSALVTTQSDGVNVTLSTGEDSIIVTGGVGQVIKTFDDKGNEQDISLSVSGVPTNASVNGDDLVVTIDGKDSTYAGKAKDTVTITSGDRTYTATKNRIMDITDENAKSVTLTTDYTSTSYTFGKTYSAGVTKLDGTQAASTKLNVNGASSEADLVLKGVSNVKNTLTGGSGADTITGGDKNDRLTGNAGKDVFVQSDGTDTIVDYTEGEDIISLQSAITDTQAEGNNVTISTDAGTIIVLNVSGKDNITTVIGGDNALASTNDELWGVSGEKDTFLFDGGKDTIHNYEEDDVINLGNFALSDLVSGAPSVSDKNLVFTFDKANSLTISDVVSSGTAVTFHDGSTYTYNGKTYTRK